MRQSVKPPPSSLASGSRVQASALLRVAQAARLHVREHQRRWRVDLARDPLRRLFQHDAPDASDLHMKSKVRCAVPAAPVRSLLKLRVQHDRLVRAPLPLQRAERHEVAIVRLVCGQRRPRS